MSHFTLFDTPEGHLKLRPFSFTRPIAQMRVGIFTIAEKWEKRLGAKASFLTEPYLQAKYPAQPLAGLYINAQCLPSDALAEKIASLKAGQALVHGAKLLACHSSEPFLKSEHIKLGHFEALDWKGDLRFLEYPWQIFQFNRGEIISDFPTATAGRQSQPIADPHTRVYGAQHIFVEEGADIKAAVLNGDEGPIYIGKNAVIQEGSFIRGAFALCEASYVNMGAKMKGDTTIGPYSKVGGEISNSVIFGYSNKGHDGFLGNAVLGEWCNLGADTNNSNLKNNYGEVKVWSYAAQAQVGTGLQFCGLLMGDHSKSGINTMFNTGTVVGVSANVFGGGFPPTHIPSFAWGGQSFETFQLDKALEVAERVMARRSMPLSPADRNILTAIFEMEKMK